MTWNLHAMRDLNRADPLGELGPRVERKPEPPPAAPEPVGIITDADGKMRTNLPLPGNTDVPVWPFPTQPPLDTTTEEPGAHGFLRPLKVGDTLRIRVLDANVVCIEESDAEELNGIEFAADVRELHDLYVTIPGGGFDGRWWFRLSSEGEAWERVA